MKREKLPRMTLLNQIVLFLVAFCATLLIQMVISNYQSRYVIKPLAERTEDIQSISQFLNDTESCMQTLDNYRWDYGDVEALSGAVSDFRSSSADHLDEIESEIGQVSEAQYLLVNAAKTTYATFSATLEEIVDLLHMGQGDEAAALYYEKAEPCGSYMRQYTQQLLEQAIRDNQSAYIQLNRRNNELKELQTFMLIVCFCLGVVVVASLLALIFSVRDMAHASQAISRGDLDTPDVDESMQDEIGDMARAFNEMKRSMKRQVQLLGEKNEMERALYKKETEALELQNLMEREKLQQLRSQINPHFLFNTINVIQYTAQQEGAEKTHSMLSSLSQLFRYSLGSNEELVPLAREVHIVNEFYRLQQLRFGDRIRLEWRISPEVDLTETLAPSFLLQPLVENAFKHGLGPKEDGGCAVVRMESEGRTLYIEVSDDGAGMTAEKLADLRDNLRNPPTAGEHIGLYNVAARLRLLGSEYGMDIQSEQGRGTRVLMRLPLVTVEEEADGDDEAVDC